MAAAKIKQVAARITPIQAQYRTGDLEQLIALPGAIPSRISPFRSALTAPKAKTPNTNQQMILSVIVISRDLILLNSSFDFKLHHYPILRKLDG
jgi:hypothetical protein